MTYPFESDHLPPVSEDDIHLYLSEIHGIPRLSAEEELSLAKRCAESDEAAIRQMVKSNLRLVVSVAREYAGRGVSLMDLIQEGSIGLLAAARKFDYSMDCRFSTYATKWIRHGVTRCLINSSLIRIPHNTAEKMRKVESVQKQLAQSQEELPTVEQIAESTGLPVSKVSELIRLNPEIISLDVQTGDKETDTLSTLLEDITALQPHEALVRQELENAIHTMLSALNERQQQILRLHFGMEDGKSHSLEEIGKLLGISKERTRQIEHQAIRKLQSMGTSMGLEEFLE